MAHPNCPDCGVLLAPWQHRVHACYELRWAETEAAVLESEVADYLASARGRFELFYAERSRQL